MSYTIKNGKVWYYLQQITQAHADTFTILSVDYAKDKYHVYYREQVLKEADPETVVVFEHGYLKDKKQVFSYGRPFQLDSDSFEHLSEGYCKDNKGIYYYEDALEGVHRPSFTVLNCNYAIDAKHAYCGDDMLEGADRTTFEALSYSYAKDKNQVYHFSSVMKKAEATTFQLLETPKDLSGSYAKDAHHIFHGESMFIGADRETFELINAYFAKDANHVYRFSEKLQGVDVDSFHVIDENYYADAHFVYDDYTDLRPRKVCQNTGDFLPLEGSYFQLEETIYYFSDEHPISTVQKGFQKINRDWAKDETTVFYQGEVMATATAIQCKDLGYEYVQVQDRLYYYGTEIKDVDVTTFELLDLWFSKDQYSLFFMHERIEGSTPEGFTHIEADWYGDHNQAYHVDDKFEVLTIVKGLQMEQARVLQWGYITDEKNVYYYDTPIIDADPATFTVLPYGYAMDQKYVFNAGKKLAGLVPEHTQFKHFRYAYDQKYCYYDSIRVPIDIATLTFINEYYIKDENAVYYNGELLEGKEAASFDKLGLFFYADTHHVYYENTDIDLDPKHVIVKKEGHAYDHRNVYFLGNQLPLAVASLQILEGNFAKDATQVYFREKRIEGADAASFEILSYGQFKDKNHVYGMRNGMVTVVESVESKRSN